MEKNKEQHESSLAATNTRPSAVVVAPSPFSTSSWPFLFPPTPSSPLEPQEGELEEEQQILQPLHSPAAGLVEKQRPHYILRHHRYQHGRKPTKQANLLQTKSPDKHQRRYYYYNQKKSYCYYYQALSTRRNNGTSTKNQPHCTRNQLQPQQKWNKRPTPQQQLSTTTTTTPLSQKESFCTEKKQPELLQLKMGFSFLRNKEELQQPQPAKRCWRLEQQHCCQEPKAAVGTEPEHSELSEEDLPVSAAAEVDSSGNNNRAAAAVADREDQQKRDWLLNVRSESEGSSFKVPRSRGIRSFKWGTYNDFGEGDHAGSLLKNVVTEIDALPKGYNYWNQRVDEEDVEDIAESEEFERMYMEQQAKQLPFRTSTTEWTLNTAAGCMVFLMAWGPIMMVLAFVLGGLLGFGFAVAHDLWRMRKKQTAANKQKEKVDQLMRWADFHFTTSASQLQLIFKVILEYQVLVRLGIFSKTARSQLKLLYHFLSRNDVGRCLWLYLDFFELHYRLMTRSEIAMCALVCSVSVECCRSLRKKSPPIIVLRMMQMIEDPRILKILQLGKNAAPVFKVKQDRKLREMDAIMYADAAKEVQRHILRGGELFDPLGTDPTRTFSLKQEESEEGESEGEPEEKEQSVIGGGERQSVSAVLNELLDTPPQQQPVPSPQPVSASSAPPTPPQEASSAAVHELITTEPERSLRRRRSSLPIAFASKEEAAPHPSLQETAAGAPPASLVEVSVEDSAGIPSTPRSGMMGPLMPVKNFNVALPLHQGKEHLKSHSAESLDAAPAAIVEEGPTALVVGAPPAGAVKEKQQQHLRGATGVTTTTGVAPSVASSVAGTGASRLLLRRSFSSRRRSALSAAASVSATTQVQTFDSKETAAAASGPSLPFIPPSGDATTPSAMTGTFLLGTTTPMGGGGGPAPAAPLSSGVVAGEAVPGPPSSVTQQRGSFHSDLPETEGDKECLLASRRPRHSITGGPPRLFKSFPDLVNFDVTLKHQTPIGLYELQFLDDLEFHDPNDSNWELVVDHKAIKVHKFISPDSPVVLVKAYAQLDGIPMPVLCHHIRDIQTRLKWDTTFEEFRVIETNVEHNEIIYCVMRAPFPVSNRDFLQWRRTRVSPDADLVTIMMRSADHPSMPERQGVIRAETIISGYKMRRTPNDSSTLFILAQTDVKGLIPKWVVNTTAARAPVGWVDNLKKTCLNYMKKNNSDVPPETLLPS